MDKMFERLNRIFPNSDYALIPPYDPEQWKGRGYDSSFDTKASINKWQTKPLSYADACEKIEQGFRIGWVVPKGVAVVDIDNKDNPRSQEYVEKLIEKFEVDCSWNYTSKGIHIIFTDPNQAIKTVARFKCGLNVQIDVRANHTGYVILPVNDPHREWGELNDINEELPYFLKPLLSNDNTQSFIGLANGDGRNDAMWRWRIKLEQCHKLDAKEVEKCIRIINENFFDQPMTNEELCKTVLRQKRNDRKDEKEERQNMHNALAEELMSKIDIIYYGGHFYSFNGTYYKEIPTIEVEQNIHFQLSQQLSSSARNEIIEFLKVKTRLPDGELDKEWHKIACGNGTINLVTGELEPPNKSSYNTIHIPWKYRNDPLYSPLIDQFMKDITSGDPFKIEFLYQVAGYCLLKRNIFEKFFIMVGEGGTGKSTYANLLQKLVDSSNCSHINLSQFDSDYYLATTLSKLLNIDDDMVDGQTLKDTGRFKSFVSGNEISCRQIYKDVLTFSPFATLIFNCNRLPRIMDRSTGLYRRMVLIELNHKVENPDPTFLDKVSETDMEYLFFKAVQGIMTAIEEGHFRINYSEDKLLYLFKRRQSPLNEWLYESNMTLGKLNGKRSSVLYSLFTDWCTRNGYTKIINAFSFKEEICALYDMELSLQISEETNAPVQVFFKRGNFDPDWTPNPEVK